MLIEFDVRFVVCVLIAAIAFPDNRLVIPIFEVDTLVTFITGTVMKLPTVK